MTFSLLVVLSLVAIATLPCFVVGLASGLFLAKTSETFKLSELQFAEAHLQASTIGYTVTILMVDQATGSTILKVANLSRDAFLDPTNLPSSLRRCDWILEVLAENERPDKLLDNLRSDQDYLGGIVDGWTLDYLRFEGRLVSLPRVAPCYTMKTVLCSVSQAIPSLPALDPKQVTEKLLLVDTTSNSDHALFLGRVCHSGVGGTLSISGGNWSLRPYQYSSAFNQKAAEIIIDWLISRVQSDSLPMSPPLLLDPTCGSGTFLALAMEQGWRVEGYDVNPYCAEGTLRNLKHMFGDERVQMMALVECRDSSRELKNTEVIPACVVANLPWGVNSIDYQFENQRILGGVHVRLKAGTPCVFVTKNAESTLFQDSGYEILAQARIPPRDSQLPKSRKTASDDNGDLRKGRNHCFVTMAIST
jgi:hypothetical protein